MQRINKFNRGFSVLLSFVYTQIEPYRSSSYFFSCHDVEFKSLRQNYILGSKIGSNFCDICVKYCFAVFR